MTTAIAERPANGGAVAVNPATQFRRDAAKVATTLLAEWVGEERSKEATGRISAALAASAASARDPSDFYACTLQSIATCVAVAALTGIMPGVGSTALAYVVPQRARRGEQPQLQYSLSHRGLNALARRCGQTMVVLPIGTRDQIQTNSDGDVEVLTRDIDNPPTKFEELRGVVVIVKEISNGVVLSRGWVPRKLIEQRRAISRSFTGSNPQYSPWSTWPIEMAMKTAMHYAISRGWCVIDDTSAARAMTADVESDAKPLLAPESLPAISDGRSASDHLADMLEGKTAETAQDEQPQESHQSNATDPPEESTADESQEPDEFAPLENESDGGLYARFVKELEAASGKERLKLIVKGIERAAGNSWIGDDHQKDLANKIDAAEKRLKKRPAGTLV